MRFSKNFLAAFLVMAFASAAFGQWVNSTLIGAMKDYNPTLKDDFYAAVNHEWLTSAKLKPGRSANAASYELQDVVDERIKKIISDENLTGHDGELVKRLYSLWLNWDARNSAGLVDLREQSELITKIKTLDELSAYFLTEDSFYNGTVIAGYTLGTDDKNSEAYNLELTSTSLSLGDSAEYRALTSNGERTKKMHDAIVRYMLSRLGYDDEEISKLLASAFSFEEKIAPYIMTLEEFYSPDAIEKMYNPLSIEELREKSPVFPYAKIIETHKAVSNYMNLEEPEWLKALNELYTPENLESIKAYLLCNLVSGYMGKIDEPAYRELQKISRERYGISESKPDKDLAVDFVHDQIPVVVSRLYVSRYVPESTKLEVKNIIQDTVKYYREMLANEEWLSESTRKKAIEKLDAMRLNSAYPDKWVDFSALEIPAGTSFYEALKILQRYKTQKYFYDRLNTKVDHDIWIDDIAVANSYYRPTENSINIIAGILGGDFYDERMTDRKSVG